MRVERDVSPRGGGGGTLGGGGGRGWETVR